MTFACCECRRELAEGQPVTCASCVVAIEVESKCDLSHVGDEPDRMETLRNWVLSQKMRGNLTPHEVELFEQAIEDVQVGSW